MVSFRQQMQELADKIATSRSERQQAVAQFPKMREQLRKQVIRLRTETRRELDQTSRTLTRQLQSFNAANKRAVSRQLRETRTARMNSAKSLRSRLQRDVSRNRSDVARSLQQNNAERKRMHRMQLRQNHQVNQSIVARVNSLRSNTRRMTRSLNQDRMEARRIWSHLKLSGVAYRPAARAIEPSKLMPSITAAPVVLGERSGLAMPPASLQCV